MRSFACATCGQLVFFENTACLRCGSELGFDWERRTVLTLNGGAARCANRGAAGCNWLVAREGELCASCRLTRTRPADDDPAALEHFRVAEAAKRWLLFGHTGPSGHRSFSSAKRAASWLWKIGVEDRNAPALAI